MRVDLTSNLGQVMAEAQRLHPQFRFATAKALTDTVRVVQAAMPAHLERTLDSPTQFTKAGFFIQPARKDTLTAAVGVKDRQAQYLAYQVEGGTRAPSRQALRLPSVVDLNESGNLPAGLIRQLVARARAGRRATGRQSQRSVSVAEWTCSTASPATAAPPASTSASPWARAASNWCPSS